MFLSDDAMFTPNYGQHASFPALIISDYSFIDSVLKCILSKIFIHWFCYSVILCSVSAHESIIHHGIAEHFIDQWTYRAMVKGSLVFMKDCQYPKKKDYLLLKSTTRAFHGFDTIWIVFCFSYKCKAMKWWNEKDQSLMMINFSRRLGLDTQPLGFPKRWLWIGLVVLHT